MGQRPPEVLFLDARSCLQRCGDLLVYRCRQRTQITGNEDEGSLPVVQSHNSMKDPVMHAFGGPRPVANQWLAGIRRNIDPSRTGPKLSPLFGAATMNEDRSQAK